MSSLFQPGRIGELQLRNRLVRSATFEAMEDVLDSGDADFVSLGRALIADARYPRKLEGGRRSDSICVHCNLCLAYMAVAPLRCYLGKRPQRAPAGQEMTAG